MTEPRLIVEVRYGKLAGTKKAVEAGRALKVGRTELADLVVQHDGSMSGTHFELQWDGARCLLRDLTSQGGTRTYTFAGLVPGPYSVVTYTARPGNFEGHLLIDIPGSSEGQLTASGTPTGNTFTPGGSHVVHTLTLLGTSFDINLTDGAGAPAGYVDGFQITLVPEPATCATPLAAALLRGRRPRRA